MSHKESTNKNELNRIGDPNPIGPVQPFVFSSQSLEEACSFISSIFCPHELQGIGETVKPNIVVKHVPLVDTSINYLAHGSRVSIKPEPFKNFYLLQAPISGYAKVTRGDKELVVEEGSATISAPDEEIWMDWSEDCQKIILRINRTTLESMYGSITGVAPSGALRFEDVISFKPGAMQSVWRMIQMIYDDLIENEGSIFQNEFAIQHMEQSLLFALLNSGVYPQPNSRSSRMNEIAPRQVKVVEDYIHANAKEAITVEQLVEISGVSARTLFDNFKKFRGITPMRYVKDVRMQCVRERLITPQSGDSVTSVAMRWGFSQLGRFAVNYKELFGESPSETLKRAQENNGAW